MTPHCNGRLPGGNRTTGPANARELSVYHGTTFLGSVRGAAGKYEARDARWRCLGKFKTVKKAADAISERCVGSAG
jgi:hypothetical protein